MKYAFDEIRQLVKSVSGPISNRDPVVRYICALVAEIAYHHVPQYEIDDKKRAKVIPCKDFGDIVARGRETNVTRYFDALDFNDSFVVLDRGVIAVGIAIDNCLFVGLRGTKFLFDWKINVKTSMVKIDRNKLFYDMDVIGKSLGGRYHIGFLEESLRISLRIKDAIEDIGLRDIGCIFLSGHSLGGAVAAISGTILTVKTTSTCIFGSPRYCDILAYFNLVDKPPVQIRRNGDTIPFIPPRKLGYADHPYEFGTNGQLIVGQRKSRSFSFLLRKWGKFVVKKFEPHDISLYRKELGYTCGASGAKLPLVPYEKIVKHHII